MTVEQLIGKLQEHRPTAAVVVDGKNITGIHAVADSVNIISSSPKSEPSDTFFRGRPL